MDLAITNRRYRSSLRCAAAITLQLLIPAFAGLLEATEPPSTVLTDLAWIAGDWVGGEDGTSIQEQWSAPEGNNMMGMFRLVQEGKVVFYEFMSIEQEDHGPVLRIKHFNPGLVGWEEKADSVVFELQEIGDHKAVFETLKDENPERLVYERHQDELVITLEKPAKGTRTPFRYQLQER